MSGSGRRQMVQHEQEGLLFKKDGVCKFFKRDQLVLNTYARRSKQQKASALLHSHRRFAGRDKDVNCLQESNLSPIDEYTCQLLDYRLYLTDDGQLKASARLYVVVVKMQKYERTLG